MHTANSELSDFGKWLRNNSFLNDFYVSDPIGTKLTEIIWTLIFIVFTKNVLLCIKTTLGIWFLSIYGFGSRRGH